MDSESNQWYHTEQLVAATAQKFVPAGIEKHIIGPAPYEMRIN